MMRTSRTAVRTVGLAIALAVAMARPATAQQDSLADLPGLAQGGRFDRVLALLEDDSHHGGHPAVVDLVGSLRRYRQHEQAQDQKRHEDWEAAVEKMRQHAEAEQTEDALLSAIEAHGLSDDPDQLLGEELTLQVVKRAEAAAREAEEAGDWLEVLNLYRELNLLFDDWATYLPQTKDAQRHVRVLRLYAPTTLKALLKARTERKRQREALEPQADPPGEPEEPEEPDFDDETWQQRLSGVRLKMVRETLMYAAGKHVESSGYGPLVAGALDALITMAKTPQLVESFPSFEDPHRRERFIAFLQDQQKLIRQRGDSFNVIDGTRMIDEIKSMNERTLALPTEVLAYEMADGALSSLDDFTSVIWPRDMEQFSRSFRGKFFGVGIQISKRDGRLVVISPLADTPAMRAGIEAGDVIAEVDGLDTSSWSLDRAVRQITGPEGTTVELGIERPGDKEPHRYRIKRAEIVIASIRGWDRDPDGSWNYFIDPVSRIGYVRLSQFIPQTVDDLDDAITRMEASRGLRGLILDLRFNPGGLLGSAVDVCDRFIPAGPIVSTVNASGERTHDAPRARADRTHRPFPMVVLINQGSASASEIVSGALQDYGRAVIVGDRSFGKGSVQDLFKIDGGRAYLKLTTQYYVLPKGRIIHRKPGSLTWGIEPDLSIKMTNQQIADAIELRQEADVLRNGQDGPDPQGDPEPDATDLVDTGLDMQLEAALLVLKTRLVARHIALAQRDEPVLVP